ncbi:MAG: hypothetical protein ACRC2S_21930 [Waterburya sp.]
MNLNFTKLLAIALLLFAIAFTPINSAMPTASFAIAGTVKSNSADTTKQAAKEVVKDTGVKQQFGQTEKGEELIDKAQEHASQKLDDLANKAESQEDLPNSQQRFLKNLSDKH